MDLKNTVVQTITFDTRPDFKVDELKAIALFLIEHDKDKAEAPSLTEEPSCIVASKKNFFENAKRT